jgi:hypothetical protein
MVMGALAYDIHSDFERSLGEAKVATVVSTWKKETMEILLVMCI